MFNPNPIKPGEMSFVSGNTAKPNVKLTKEVDPIVCIRRSLLFVGPKSLVESQIDVAKTYLNEELMRRAEKGRVALFEEAREGINLQAKDLTYRPPLSTVMLALVVMAVSLGVGFFAVHGVLCWMAGF